MLKPLTRIAAACALLFSQSVYSASLQDVLRQSLQNDPELLEAQANKQAADSDIKIAKSGHLPTLTATATQVLAQSHRYESNERKRGINPGLQGKLNLYSFGGIDSRIRYSEHKYDYYHYKYYETQEVLGQTIGRLYLAALRAKESIQAAQNNLQRHDKIIGDLKIITQYDKGRQSELDQALARRLRVQAYLVEQTRVLELNLSRLGKYTQTRLSPATLQDPFAGETAVSVMRRYRSADLAMQPSYQAQQAERESVLAEIDVNKSSRFPSIDLIASATRDNKEIYLNFGWDFFNPSANYQVERSAQTLVAAEAKADQILRDVSERTRSAEVDMRQSLNRTHIAEQQIAAQKKVIKAYELQFKIARRTLIDVLDSYSDLWSIESEVVASRNDFRDAALEYLSSQAAIAQWAGLNQDRNIPTRRERKTFRDHLPDNFLPANIQNRLNAWLDKDNIQTDTISKDGEPVLNYDQVTQDNIQVNMPAVTPNSVIQTQPVLNYQQINDNTQISAPVSNSDNPNNTGNQLANDAVQNPPVLNYDDIMGQSAHSAVAPADEVYQPKTLKNINKIKKVNKIKSQAQQLKNRQPEKNALPDVNVDNTYVEPDNTQPEQTHSIASQLPDDNSTNNTPVKLIDAPEHGVVWQDTGKSSSKFPHQTQHKKNSATAKNAAKKAVKKAKTAIKQGKKTLTPAIAPTQKSDKKSDSKSKSKKKMTQVSVSDLQTNWVWETRVPYENYFFQAA
ncbi:TolC family protein [Simonsiella muelleri]|uniref:TolC family type I secretion outer membrane protein n=1 Tax=Simonsiella muelleri ATCC 29453 TaxID=641147 RepID=V9HCR0_9NEIS|nr:TolC family protein [Simonsiella muelleri]AUX61381.1 hypothetical protein BWP33_05875 [Simonsiella muelleri ATCC 29453]EFG31104.1 hypothetical protein HMPREF9021_00933 [Simonsiella muelleri ATCC 29453]UBQ53432.1 TolC family protein [Simonsiella muelleri]